MENFITGVLLAELATRRSPLSRAERNRVQLRAGALALVGFNPAFGAVDAVQEVRRIERRRQSDLQPPRVGAQRSFVTRGQQVIAAFTSLAAEAETEVERIEAELTATREALEENEAALDASREDARKLKECADSLQGVFEDDHDHGDRARGGDNE